MIHYALRCGAGHAFDGWFNSSGSFDAQSEAGLLTCPMCGNTVIERGIMAPRLSRGAVAAPAEQAAPAPAVAPEPPSPALPDQVRAVLQRIRAEVEKRCDYVGPAFADTARRIHAGTEPHRPIYGEATPDEATSLEDDGIKISQIPWVPRADG